MYKILKLLLLWFLLLNTFNYTISQTNAAWLDSTWHLIDRTTDNNIKILKGTPFKFSFYNKLYNYFRLTDDWALVFWISPDNNNLSEGAYLADKNNAIIKTKAWESVILEFLVNKTKIIIPAWINYININGQYKISDWTTPVNIRVWNKIELAWWEELLSNSWLYGIKVDDKSKLEEYHDNVKYDDTWTNSYVMITPWFINLDLSDPDGTKWYWIYEKQYYDTKWNLYADWFLWYWVVEWTDKEVQYWIVLYNSTYYNNIRLFYWKIDSSINTPVFVWISNWNASDKKNVAYSNQALGSLSWKDDILIDGSKIFQELNFQIWYDPDTLDPNKNLILDYQERDTNPPYTILDKPQSKYAIKFKVKINTDKTVCQREWVTSDGWDTLRWWKKDSTRVDFDDIDTFCFVAETPWIAVLDNATYAKWGYKTWQSNCVVNHLALMWFNSQSIGWNTDNANNCWMTYKIDKEKKDLSLDKESPYEVINKFLDDVDLRPVDTSITINKQHIAFWNPKPLIIATATWNKEMSVIDNNFKPLELDMINEKISYLIGTNWNDSYLLYTNNRWDTWKIIKKIDNKIISYFTIMDNIVLIFFDDWTYIRNINNWLDDDWQEKTLENYDVINSSAIITNRRMILIWNNGKMWKTFSGWDNFDFIDAKANFNLQWWENLQSIDIYGSNYIWISTNRGNILFSSNAWDTFIKKTTWSSIEYVLNTFEDWINVFKNLFNINSIGNSLDYIDTETNWKSLKFNDGYQYLQWCVDWQKWSQQNIIDSTNYTNLEPFTVDEYDKYYPKWDLYIDFYIDTKEQWKSVKDIILEDIYWHSISVNVDKIFTNNGEKQKIGWNTVKVSINDYNWDTYVLDAPDNTTPTEEHYQKINKYTIITNWTLESDERIGIWKIQFAPSTNLTNITTINTFDSDLSNTSSRTCNLNNTKVMTQMIDWNLDLNTFVWTDWNLKWFLTLDLYVEDKNKWDIDKIEIGNDNNKKIVWSNLSSFSTLWIDKIVNWWNTFILPFDESVSTNIDYVNKKDINWKNLTLFKILTNNNNEDKFNRYAIDNIRYSSVANTNLKFIRFFNKKEWLAFDNSNTYITNNNNTWGMNASFSRWPSSNMNFKKVIRIKWREVYAIGNDSQGWFSYYSLDKWKNNKIYFSDSWVNLTSFDMVDPTNWLAISSNWNIYELELVND